MNLNTTSGYLYSSYDNTTFGSDLYNYISYIVFRSGSEHNIDGKKYDGEL